jgi:hypothetical protein
MMVQTKLDKEKQQQQIQPKLSTIFKEKVAEIPQSFGSFVNDSGEKYCAVSALLKYLGHDMSRRTTTVVNEAQNGKNDINIELIPSGILETVENFVPCSNIRKYPTGCFCSKPDYYYSYSLISLLIHLNDYHKMTFREIGIWLESKGM